MNRKRLRRIRDIDRPILDLATHPTETVTPKVLAECQRVKCDVRTVIRMVEIGALSGYRVGREWRISVESACVAFGVERDPMVRANLDAVTHAALKQIIEAQELAKAKDEEAMAARRRVNHLVEKGRLPHPSLKPCCDCGHIGADRKHEYDHHNGYGPEHVEDVVVRCQPCHRNRHASAAAS